MFYFQSVQVFRFQPVPPAIVGRENTATATDMTPRGDDDEIQDPGARSVVSPSNRAASLSGHSVLGSAIAVRVRWPKATRCKLIAVNTVPPSPGRDELPAPKAGGTSCVRGGPGRQPDVPHRSPVGGDVHRPKERGGANPGECIEWSKTKCTMTPGLAGGTDSKLRAIELVQYGKWHVRRVSESFPLAADGKRRNQEPKAGDRAS